MADNQNVDAAADYDVATDKVTHSGDADQNVQLIRPVHVTGSEGSKTVVDISSADGLLVNLGANNDVTVTGNVAVTNAGLTELAGAITAAGDMQVTGRNVAVVSDTLSSLNDSAVFDVANYATAYIDLQFGSSGGGASFTGTVLIQGSDGTTWDYTPVFGQSVGGGPGNGDYAVSGADYEFGIVVPIEGLQQLRAFVFAYTSGDVKVSCRLSTMPSQVVSNSAKLFAEDFATGTPVAIAVNPNTEGIHAGGDLAHDDPDDGFPLKIGGKANTAPPANVADGDRVNASFALNGSQRVAIVGSDGREALVSSDNNIGLYVTPVDDGGNTAAVVITDGDAKATQSLDSKAVRNYGFNGTTWDRLRSDTANGLDVDVTRLPAAVETDIADMSSTITADSKTFGTSTYTEGATTGGLLGAVRRDADTTLVNTTNEIGPLQMDANGRLKVEAFSGETLPVSGTVTANLAAGTATNEVVGDVAHSAGAAGNPVLIAGISVDTDDTAPPNRVDAESDATRLATDYDGALFAHPHGPQIWSYHLDTSTAQTDTTVHASPGSGLSLYVTDIVFSSGAATAINLFFEEGSTKVLGPYYLEAIAGRGMALHFTTPKKITAATALTLTTSASIAHSVDVMGWVGDG